MQSATYVGPRDELKNKTAQIKPHRLWPETMVLAQFDDHTLEEHTQWWPFALEHFSVAKDPSGSVSQP